MIGLLLLGLVILLLGAYLFTNAIEWTGKRLKLSEGVVGSVLAGVGTALPETIIPIVAIFFTHGEASDAVGVGAILGAPFMLSCLTLPMVGTTILLLAWAHRRPAKVLMNAGVSRIDLGYFLAAYALAFGVALLPAGANVPALRGVAAFALIVLYVFYLRTLVGHAAAAHTTVDPLIFHRRSHEPHSAVIGLQVVIGLGVIIFGAHLFVDGVEHLSQAFAWPPLVVSLLITPIATELPEKLNSLIWVSQKKDTLAIGNITGAMVFQGTFPVAVGLIGTPWQLDYFGLASVVLAFAAAAWLYALLRWRGGWHPAMLIAAFALYLLYGVMVMTGV